MCGFTCGLSCTVSRVCLREPDSSVPGSRFREGPSVQLVGAAVQGFGALAAFPLLRPSSRAGVPASNRGVDHPLPMDAVLPACFGGTVAGCARVQLLPAPGGLRPFSWTVPHPRVCFVRCCGSPSTLLLFWCAGHICSIFLCHLLCAFGCQVVMCVLRASCREAREVGLSHLCYSHRGKQGERPLVQGPGPV